MNNPQDNVIADWLRRESLRLLDPTTSDWETQPVPLKEFAEDHLNINLSPRQYQDLVTFLGEDPIKTFAGGSPYNMLCLLAGKGSGKDFMASIVVNYLLYLLLCMRNPHTYLDWPIGESIDIIVVSYSSEQTELTTFDKIKQRMRNWFWLKTKYSIIDGDRYINQKGMPVIHIFNDIIKTHHNIRIIAEHSANESYEGYNILAWVMSEASAFKAHTKERNAQKVFATLRTSASSRFNNRWKGMVMSFPRFDENTDFTYLLYEQAKKGVADATGRIWPSKGATWDYKPSKYYPSGKFFDFEGHQVPIELRADFEEDPDECRKKYLCIPPKAGARIVADTAILKAIHSQPPIVTFDPYLNEETNKIMMKIVGLDRPDLLTNNYLITVDLGEVNSAAAVCISHLEEGAGYVQDALGAWTPNPDKGTAVDLIDVRNTLKYLAKTIPRVRVAFDQWQSRLFRSELQQEGIKVDEYHTKSEDYSIFTKAMSLGIAHILDDETLKVQLSSLKEKDGRTFSDPKISTRKDLVDVTVGGFKMLMGKTVSTDLDGELIAGNLSEFGSVLPSQSW